MMLPSDVRVVHQRTASTQIRSASGVTQQYSRSGWAYPSTAHPHAHEPSDQRFTGIDQVPNYSPSSLPFTHVGQRHNTRNDQASHSSIAGCSYTRTNTSYQPQNTSYIRTRAYSSNANLSHTYAANGAEQSNAIQTWKSYGTTWGIPQRQLSNFGNYNAHPPLRTHRSHAVLPNPSQYTLVPADRPGISDSLPTPLGSQCSKAVHPRSSQHLLTAVGDSRNFRTGQTYLRSHRSHAVLQSTASQQVDSLARSCTASSRPSTRPDNNFRSRLLSNISACFKKNSVDSNKAQNHVGHPARPAAVGGLPSQTVAGHQPDEAGYITRIPRVVPNHPAPQLINDIVAPLQSQTTIYSPDGTAYGIWICSYLRTLYGSRKRIPVSEMGPDADPNTFEETAQCIGDIVEKAELAPWINFLALWYINRLPSNLVEDVNKQEYSDKLTIKAVTVQTFVVGCMLATKYLEDYALQARNWHAISGLQPKFLNKLEIAALQSLEWVVNCNRTQWHKWLLRLRDLHADPCRVVDSCSFGARERAARESIRATIVEYLLVLNNRPPTKDGIVFNMLKYAARQNR